MSFATGNEKPSKEQKLKAIHIISENPVKGKLRKAIIAMCKLAYKKLKSK